jgi:hypothetical protein
VKQPTNLSAALKAADRFVGCFMSKKDYRIGLSYPAQATLIQHVSVIGFYGFSRRVMDKPEKLEVNESASRLRLEQVSLLGISIFANF